MKTEITKKMDRFVEDAKVMEEELLVLKIQQSKELAMNTFFQCAVNIGECLLEAKEIVKHGEWENWLTERVNFSMRTAQNHMKIYKETEKNGSDLLKTQAFADLGYSQVVEILSLPGEMQEELLQTQNVKEMSSRELKKTVNEMKTENKELTEKVKLMEKEKASYEKTTKKSDDEIKALIEKMKKLEEKESLANQKNDKETEAKVAKAIKSTEEDLAKAINEKKTLETNMLKKEQSYKAEIAKIKEEAENRVKAQIADKDKELENMSKDFTKQIAKMQEWIKKTEEEKMNAEIKA